MRLLELRHNLSFQCYFSCRLDTGRGFLGKLRTVKPQGFFFNCRGLVHPRHFENRLLKGGYEFDSCKPATFKLNTEKLHDCQLRLLG